MASITMVLDGIQSLILEVIIKFRPYLWGVQMAYVAGGGVGLVMLVSQCGQ